MAGDEIASFSHEESRRDPLVQGFLHGDAEATVRVAAVARRVVGDRGYYIRSGEREDVVQQVLLDTYRAVTRPGFVLQREFASLVRSIACRRCVDWMRRERPTVGLTPGIADDRANPHERLKVQETIELGRRALRDLSERCRELIRMRIRDGLSYRSIAERLRSSEGAVRNRMYKCLQRAKRILAAMTEPPDGIAPRESEP
jgi:RNA polymerase sigma-70 factor (ECF subfamily)